MTMKKSRVEIGYTDGRYSFRRMDTHEDRSPTEVLVPDTTLRMWEEARAFDSAVQDQIRSFEDDRILDEEADRGDW